MSLQKKRQFTHKKTSAGYDNFVLQIYALSINFQIMRLTHCDIDYKGERAKKNYEYFTTSYKTYEMAKKGLNV